MQDEGYIKLNRKILDWEWYKNINTKVLFFHMLLKANWKEGKFEGQTIPRGSFVSSLPKLADETELTIREVRTAISHLKSTGELTVKSYSKYSVFTVNNYNSYQYSDIQNDIQPTGKRHSNDILTTTIEEREERKNRKSISKDIPKRFVTDDSLNKAILDFIEFRKNIKKPMTDRAVTLLINKLDKLTSDVSEKIEILNQSVINNWNSVYPLKNDSEEQVRPNKFKNFTERDNDYAELQTELLKKGMK